jgi:hypothetical protein
LHIAWRKPGYMFFQAKIDGLFDGNMRHGIAFEIAFLPSL